MATTTTADESIPREPSAYRPSNHLAEHVKGLTDDGADRHLDGDVIRACIERGTVTHAGGPAYRFEATIGGVTYRLVVNADRNVAVTCHPIGINCDAARASGRWSSAQIDDIRTFVSRKGE